MQELRDRIGKYVAKFEADCNVFGFDVSQTVINDRVGEKKQSRINIEMEVAKMKDSKKQYQDAIAAHGAELEDKKLQIRSFGQENTSMVLSDNWALLDICKGKCPVIPPDICIPYF